MHETCAPVISGRFISVGSACDLECAFCGREGLAGRVDMIELQKSIARAREDGCERIVFRGGEPLAQKAIVRLLGSARQAGLKTGLSTSARAIVSRDLAQKFAKLGLDSISIWLCGPRPDVHDGLVGVRGAFSRTLRAIGHWTSLPGVKIELRFPLLSANAGLTGEFLDFVDAMPRRTGMYVSLAYPEPAMRSRAESAERTFVRPEKAAEIIRTALQERRPGGIPIYYEGLPKCLIGGFPDRNLDRYRDFDAGSGGDGLGGCVNGPSAAGDKKLLPCSECVDACSCRGISRAAVEEYEFSGVVPTRGVQSNSFDYLRDSVVEGFRPQAEGCAGREIPAAGGVERNLILSEAGGMRRYQADTTSFSSEEMRRIKQVDQQIYVDVSDKVALDDFQKDVKQARLVKECRECANRPSCVMVFEISAEVPFHREERWLRGEIGRMRGRVLDLGCGDLRYQEIVAGLARAGQVEYHGLDPDGEALAKLRKADFPIKIYNQGVEEFSSEAGYYDYVLMLRSINHFRDLKKTFDVVTRSLRNYGQLIITDSIPMALLRSREKTAAARASLLPRFEHYRNFASQQVIEFLRTNKYPFVLNIHRPVMAKTSNLWLLKLIKIAGPEGGQTE